MSAVFIRGASDPPEMNVLGVELTTKNIMITAGVLGLVLVAIIVHAQAIGWGIPPASTQPCMVYH